MSEPNNSIQQPPQLDYEERLAEVYARFVKPGDTVLDIGAHEGFHTERLAQLVGSSGKVIAFEPLPEFAVRLRQRLAGLLQVEVRELALGNFPGRAPFVYVVNAPQESGLRERIYNISNPEKREIEVRIETLDRIQAAPVAYIKIDIEGGEIDCLRGGTGVLKRYRPIVSVEYGKPSYSGYGHEAGTLYDFAVAHDYLLADLACKLIPTRAEWFAECDRSYWDWFLVPRERVDDWYRVASG